MSRTAITMPALSDTMQTGRLVSWLKQPGDPVHRGEAIAEVESDKAVMEVEAFQDGYLAGPLAEPGSDLPVGQVIGYLADSPDTDTGEEAPAAAEPPPETEQQPERPEPEPPQAHQAAEPPPAPPSSPPASRGGGAPVAASPYARALARELGIDLAQVAPGPDGRVQAAQVVAAALAGPQPDLDAGPPWTLQPLSPMQQAVADNMRASLAIPSFRVSARLPLELLAAAAKAQRHSLSLLLARACALAVRAHPRFNAAFTPAGLAQRERVDVGIAVDVPDGLVTPVIRDAAGRPLDELAEDWRILKNKIARRRLRPEDYSGATFYLSNLGTFPEVTVFDAIVPMGAAAILAVGAAHDGEARFTLSCDHRVVYGADAARFLATLGELLRDPAQVTGTTT